MKNYTFDAKKVKKDLVNWIMEDNLNVRVQIQLHKILNAKQKEVNANELWK